MTDKARTTIDLAEYNLAVLTPTKQAGGAGYDRTFLIGFNMAMDEICQRRIKLVVNAGGAAPERLAADIRKMVKDKNYPHIKVMHLEGDNVLEMLPSLIRQGYDLKHMDTGVPITDWKLVWYCRLIFFIVPVVNTYGPYWLDRNQLVPMHIWELGALQKH